MAAPASAAANESQSVRTSVELGAATESLNSWADAFNTASQNATDVAEFYFEAPGAALQQVIVNQMAYLQTLLDDPAAIGEVFSTISGNAGDAFRAATFLGDWELQEFVPLLLQTTDLIHGVMFGPLTGMDGSEPLLPEALIPVVYFAASPLSGALMGLVGPGVSLAIPFINPVMDVLSGGDPAVAAQNLFSAPADAVGAFFNGATLNLDPLLPLIGQLGVVPAEIQMESLSLSFGGLFSPGQTNAGFTNDGIGGSMLNALGFVGTVEGLGQQTMVGHGLGPIASFANLSQIIAQVLGWDGTGNPLADLKFPEINTGPATADPDTATGPAELPKAPGYSVTVPLTSDTQPDQTIGVNRTDTDIADSAGDSTVIVETSATQQTDETTAAATSTPTNDPAPAEDLPATPAPSASTESTTASKASEPESTAVTDGTPSGTTTVDESPGSSESVSSSSDD